MLPRTTIALIGLLSCAAMAETHASSQRVAPPKVGPSSIGGVVTGAAGPEAGVWVIAEASDLPARYTKVVITDDLGRFVLPDMPKSNYKVWVRGYGLADSDRIDATPGKTVSLTVKSAANAVEAAQIYPASYWYSLMQPPAASEFPGTGPRGNGITTDFKNQQQWMVQMGEACQVCHQVGNKPTRALMDIGDPRQAWIQRLQKNRVPDDVFFEGDLTYPKRNFGKRMPMVMENFGPRGLDMFVDWTTRIAKGETPPAPPRPTGIERNVVLTMQDMGGGRFMHEIQSTDKRDPTRNPYGRVYGYAQMSGMLIALDPKTGKEEQIKLTDRRGEHANNSNPHTGAFDAQGRIWVTRLTTEGDNPVFCTDPGNKFAKYFPREFSGGRVVTVYDPRTKKDTTVPVCFGSHHLNLDDNERLYFSGDTEVAGWIDVNVWDKTRDSSKAVGWCPLVLDTNGDGKITPDRTQWNWRSEKVAVGEAAQAAVKEQDATADTPWDPKKDTRLAGFNYGMGISPKDQSYWGARYSPFYPSGIFRVETGSRPPETCKTEYYEAPKVNGLYQAYNVRGVDLDSNGVAWLGFGTGGKIGRFDRSKCKVLNGPTATGQHCPEGWEIIDTPGPKFKGTNVGADWLYLVFVDQHNTFGLGKDVPIFPNSAGDELLAYLPKEKKFVHLRVPYPVGFYARAADGRIDDPKAGWKGRGLWSSNNLFTLYHQERGEESTEFATHFQLRPHPLAE